MKKFAIQVILLIFVIGASLLFISPGSGLNNLALPFLPQKATSASLQVGDVTLQVEVADTASKRSKGLGGREGLGENKGMLFVFTKADKYPFWMKGLKFPLDFVWIRGGEVVDVLENVQPPQAGAADSSLPIYTSKVEVDKVLEVNAGVVQRLNIKVRDKIEIK